MITATINQHDPIKPRSFANIGVGEAFTWDKEQKETVFVKITHGDNCNTISINEDGIQPHTFDRNNQAADKVLTDINLEVHLRPYSD